MWVCSILAGFRESKAFVNLTCDSQFNLRQGGMILHFKHMQAAQVKYSRKDQSYTTVCGLVTKIQSSFSLTPFTLWKNHLHTCRAECDSVQLSQLCHTWQRAYSCHTPDGSRFPSFNKSLGLEEGFKIPQHLLLFEMHHWRRWATASYPAKPLYWLSAWFIECCYTETPMEFLLLWGQMKR